MSHGSMVVGFTSAWSAGRVLAGLCIGVTSVSLPIYLAEVLDPEVRGWVPAQTGLYQGNLGVLLCYTAGSVLDCSQVTSFKSYCMKNAKKI